MCTILHESAAASAAPLCGGHHRPAASEGGDADAVHRELGRAGHRGAAALHLPGPRAHRLHQAHPGQDGAEGWIRIRRIRKPLGR